MYFLDISKTIGYNFFRTKIDLSLHHPDPYQNRNQLSSTASHGLHNMLHIICNIIILNNLYPFGTGRKTAYFNQLNYVKVILYFTVDSISYTII